MALIRVHQLAKEYGVTSEYVLEKLREMGEFVRTPSSTLQFPVEQRFRELYGNQLRSDVRQPTFRRSSGPYRESIPAVGPTFTRRKTAGGRQRSQPPPSQALIDASRIFGVPIEQLKPARQERPRGRYTSSESRRRVTQWDEHWIDDQERREWIAAGLGPEDGRIAGLLMSKGVTPSDLGLRVDGVLASQRLRGGESATSVALRILDAKKERDVG